MIKVDIQEAEANLSHYLDQIEKGEIVVICRHNKRVAELRAIETLPALTKRIPGMLKGQIHFEPDAFAPMTAEVLAEFEDGPIFPTGKA